MGNAGFMFNKCVGTVRLMFLESGVYLWGMWGLCLGIKGYSKEYGGDCQAYVFRKWGYWKCEISVWGMRGLHMGNVGFI